MPTKQRKIEVHRLTISGLPDGTAAGVAQQARRYTGMDTRGVRPAGTWLCRHQGASWQSSGVVQYGKAWQTRHAEHRDGRTRADRRRRRLGKSVRDDG